MRTLLLVAGCGPMVLTHGVLSLLMIFPVTALLHGDLRQAIFIAWWLAGTAGLGVLVYSSATFTLPPRPMVGWQMLGLLGGAVASVPLLLGFAGGWWIAVSALLATIAAVFLLINRVTVQPSAS